MNRDESRNQRIYNYLDGLLPPEEEAEVRRWLNESESWRLEAERAHTVCDLLDTPLDVEPPADLLPGVLAAIQREPAPAPRRFRLPAIAESGLVAMGVALVAASLAWITRTLSPQAVSETAVLGGARALKRIGDGVAGGADVVSTLDWIPRSMNVLADAGSTVLGSVQPLFIMGLISVALTLTFGWRFFRPARVPSRRG